MTVPDVLFQAHSAPLNIAFYDSDALGADYKGDAFVAMHGSWNRGTRTGYKVVRLPTSTTAASRPASYEDFVTGFVSRCRQRLGPPGRRRRRARRLAVRLRRRQRHDLEGQQAVAGIGP